MASRRLSSKLSLGAAYARIQSSYALTSDSSLGLINNKSSREHALLEENNMHSGCVAKGFSASVEANFSPESSTENENFNRYGKQSSMTLKKWKLDSNPSDEISRGQDSFASLAFPSQNPQSMRAGKRFTSREECRRLPTGFGMCGLPRGLVISGSMTGQMTLRGTMSVRYASSMGEGSDKVDSLPEYINDVAEVFTEKSIDAAGQAQAMSEVAIAAADSAYPVAALQYFIEFIHVNSGLPWWASIVAATIIIRCVTIPILISQLKATSRLTLMRPQMEELTQRMKECNDPRALEEGRRRMKDLFVQHGVTPFTPMKGILVQGPIFISFYLAITNMAAKIPSFKDGGALWFHDLSTPDSLYIFPALTALSFLATVELNAQEGLEGNPMADNMKKFSRFIALITVPITMSFPKAIFCYWITSNLFSLAHGLVIKRPGVKKALGIPELPVAPQAASNLVGSTKPTDKEPPSSSLVHQRLRALERTLKTTRKHGRKR